MFFQFTKKWLRGWLVSSACIAMVILLVPGFSHGLEVTMEMMLQAAYADIDATSKTPEERHARRFKALQEVTEVIAVQTEQLKALELMAARVHATGQVFDADLVKIKSFNEKLKKLNKSKTMQNISKGLDIKAKVMTGLGAMQKINSTLNNHRLPPSSRKALVALDGLGMALTEVGGKVPLVGEALESYGEIIANLTGVVEGLSTSASASVKAGVIHAAQTHEEYSGLPSTEDYLHTTYSRSGIPLVQGAISEKYYLKDTKGNWNEVNYENVAMIIEDYRITREKEPSLEQINSYLSDNEERNDMHSYAEHLLSWEACRQRMAKLMIGLPDVDLNQFVGIEEKIDKWVNELGLPLDSKAKQSLVRHYFEDPKFTIQLIQRTTGRYYPDLNKILKEQEQTLNSIPIEALVSLVAEYKAGKYVSKKEIATAKSQKTPQQASSETDHGPSQETAPPSISPNKVIVRSAEEQSSSKPSPKNEPAPNEICSCFEKIYLEEYNAGEKQNRWAWAVTEMHWDDEKKKCIGQYQLPPPFKMIVNGVVGPRIWWVERSLSAAKKKCKQK